MQAADTSITYLSSVHQADAAEPYAVQEAEYNAWPFSIRVVSMPG